MIAEPALGEALPRAGSSLERGARKRGVSGRSACNPRAPAWRATRLPGQAARADLCTQIREVQARRGSGRERAISRTWFRRHRPLRRRRLARIGAPDRLVEVDHRAGHQAGVVGGEEVHRPRHLGRVDEPAEGQPCRRLRLPVRVARLRQLQLALVVGGHPADVELVDPDAVGRDREGGVARQRRQRALGGAVGADEGLAGVRGHRADVDDRAGDAVADHQPDRLLHQEERPAHVGREHRGRRARARCRGWCRGR